MPKNEKMNEQNNALIELGRTYTYKSKQEDWVKEANKVSPESLEIAVRLMKMMESSLPFKKVYNEVEKIQDVSIRSEVLKLLLNFGKYGPEFTIDRMNKKNGGQLDKSNEMVQRAYNKMDENAYIRSRE